MKRNIVYNIIAFPRFPFEQPHMGTIQERRHRRNEVPALVQTQVAEVGGEVGPEIIDRFPAAAGSRQSSVVICTSLDRTKSAQQAELHTNGSYARNPTFDADAGSSSEVHPLTRLTAESWSWVGRGKRLRARASEREEREE
eukprot:gene9467-biopygen21232